jgi:uracil-DNA glycosylase
MSLTTPGSAARLAPFRAALQRLVGDPPAVRPFVCDGSPLECRAFIVGSHPATRAAAEFWRFWDDGEGFRRGEWLTASCAAHAPGPTRRLIERVVAAAAPVRCLEANVTGTPGTESRDAAVFELLLGEVRPRAILAHGREAAGYLAARFGTRSLATDRFTPVEAPWGTVRIRPVRHLSRGWSYAAADEAGAALREAAEAGWE